MVALLKKKKMVQSLMRDAAALDVPAVQCALQQQFDKVQRSLRTMCDQKNGALNRRLTIDMRRQMKKEREDRARKFRANINRRLKARHAKAEKRAKKLEAKGQSTKTKSQAQAKAENNAIAKGCATNVAAAASKTEPELKMPVDSFGTENNWWQTAHKTNRLNAIEYARKCLRDDPIRDIEQYSRVFQSTENARKLFADMRLQWNAFATWLADGPEKPQKGTKAKKMPNKEKKKEQSTRPVGIEFRDFLQKACEDGRSFRKEFGLRFLEFRKWQAKERQKEDKTEYLFLKAKVPKTSAPGKLH